MFLELIFLVHVIIYVVFLGFKTKIPCWCVITRMDAMQNILQLIWLLHVIVFVFFIFFWVLRLKIQVCLLLLK